MIKKLIDFADSKVCQVILFDDESDLNVALDAITHIGEDRISYHIHRDVTTLTYAMEQRMPYNRYLAFMKYIQEHGHNLEGLTETDVICKFVVN